MDDPNANWALFKMIEEERKVENNPSSIGSCIALSSWSKRNGGTLKNFCATNTSFLNILQLEGHF